MQEELKEMVENVDTDGSGSIEFLEFLLLMGKILNDSPNQEDLRNIFTGIYPASSPCSFLFLEFSPYSHYTFPRLSLSTPITASSPNIIHILL